MWTETLLDVFSAYINQGTIEEGVSQMVFVSSDSPEQHEAFCDALFEGIQAASSSDSRIRDIINSSGYQASSDEEAVALIKEVEVAYLKRFNETRKNDVAD